MDFFQVYDVQTLQRKADLPVIGEISIVFVLVVVVGVLLQRLPAFLVHSFTLSYSGASKRPGPTPVQCPIAQAAEVPEHPPASPPDNAEVEAEKTGLGLSSESSVLSGALDSFFEEEEILEESLLDANVSGGIQETRSDKDPNVSRHPKPSEESPLNANNIQRDIAQKMTRCFKKKATVAPRVPQLSKSKFTDPTATLDAALNDFWGEEDILNEAIIDCAVEESKHSA
ncbi:unnamed protein product [Phytomonas sp. Hart1]|nr:unnamed protein product [Phytomonas sp. Hart1]|eukprot:CCW69667.1 unnamed protein product [Phytomonas sp. isolate Hart1]